MSEEKYRLAVFGMSEHELRVLQTISIISRSRPRSYMLVNAAASEASDFAIVDGDDPQAQASWETFQANHPATQAIMVGRTPPTESTESWVGRPILATRLLSKLDGLELSKQRPAFVTQQTAATDLCQATPKSPVAQPPLDSAEGLAPRALVVDDSLPIRRQVQLELRRLVAAADVDLAENGERALELVVSRRYDIVFLDVVLPGMDGYDVCRTIKRSQATRDTPVIMLTGKSSPFNRVRGKLAGCDTYLTKPVDRKKFARAVETLLKKGERRQPASGRAPARIGYAKPTFA